MILTIDTIDAILAELDAGTPDRSMSEQDLVYAGFHRALELAREALHDAANLAGDDGTLPDYVAVKDVVKGRRA